jgi:hypothetical protein
MGLIIVEVKLKVNIAVESQIIRARRRISGNFFPIASQKSLRIPT